MVHGAASDDCDPRSESTLSFALIHPSLLPIQAFHGLAVALVYKYADAIVKNFANSSVMAILIVISAYVTATRL